jgi:hypothetical protein
MKLATACPKPRKRRKKGRAPIARSPMKKSRPDRNEVERSMGSDARRQFVASLPCSACGIVGYSVSAHLLGNGGMGRKKHHTTTGPLCGPHDIRGETYAGCHFVYDELRAIFNATFVGFNPVEVAVETERAWVRRSDAGGER